MALTFSPQRLMHTQQLLSEEISGKYVDEGGGALKDQDISLGTLKDDVQSLHDQGWSYVTN